MSRDTRLRESDMRRDGRGFEYPPSAKFALPGRRWWRNQFPICESEAFRLSRRLAFDGERKRRLRAGEQARLSVRREGPKVADIAAIMATAARRGLFVGESRTGFRKG